MVKGRVPLSPGNAKGQIISIREAAEWLHCSTQTVRRLHAQGCITFVPLNPNGVRKSHRVQVDSLVAYVNNAKRSAVPRRKKARS